MVGVPGKSKGCITCRRRKIRCDEKHPNCDRCSDSGKDCEGYGKYPTFLNRTAQGLQKRHALEEVKPRPSHSSDPEQAHARPGNGNQSRHVQSSEVSRRDLTVALPCMQRQASNRDPDNAQIVGLFWSLWVPTDNVAQDYSDSQWMKEALSTSTPTDALQLAVTALAFNRVGQAHHDRGFSIRGSMTYGKALRALQLALWDGSLMWRDETLAAAYALSSYELLGATTASIHGWNSHLHGIGSLIRLRGPQRSGGPLGRAVLDSFRFSLMIQSLQFRQKPFPTQTAPSFHSPSHLYYDSVPPEKVMQQRIVDHGFAIGALMGDLDHAGFQRGELTPADTLSFVRRFVDLKDQINAWYRKFRSLGPSPLYWLDDGDSRDRRDPASVHDEPAPRPYVFPNLRLATTTAICWALKILVEINLIQLSTGNVSTSPPTASTQESDRLAASTTYDPYQLSRDPITLATNIVRSTPYCLSDSQGSVGAQQSLFPLRIALLILRRHPGPESQWCLDQYRLMSEKKGVLYAREIAKVDGGYGSNKDESAPSAD